MVEATARLLSPLAAGDQKKIRVKQTAAEAVAVGKAHVEPGIRCWNVLEAPRTGDKERTAVSVASEASSAASPRLGTSVAACSSCRPTDSGCAVPEARLTGDEAMAEGHPAHAAWAAAAAAVEDAAAPVAAAAG